MLVHSMMARSTVNGPGPRAVVWFQGCDLRCVGCWNPATHPFTRERDRPVSEVGDWILACPAIEGVTFSGGEPFQQAPAWLKLCEYVKSRRPALSVGLFSGYTLRELNADRFHFAQIRRFVDFGVFGRFCRSMACDDKPLCGSSNQEVVFFSDRYSPRDLEPQGFEVSIDAAEPSSLASGYTR